MVAGVKGNMTQTKYTLLRDCMKIIWVGEGFKNRDRGVYIFSFGGRQESLTF